MCLVLRTTLDCSCAAAAASAAAAVGSVAGSCVYSDNHLMQSPKEHFCVFQLCVVDLAMFCRGCGESVWSVVAGAKGEAQRKPSSPQTTWTLSIALESLCRSPCQSIFGASDTSGRARRRGSIFICTVSIGNNKHDVVVQSEYKGAWGRDGINAHPPTLTAVAEALRSSSFAHRLHVSGILVTRRSLTPASYCI